MVAPIRFLSGRQQQQKIGIEGSTENEKVLEVIGQVGIGTTTFTTGVELEVHGDANITGILTAGSISVTGTGGGNLDVQDLNVSGISTLGSVKVSSGIVTAVSGVVTYYGDGSQLSNLPSSGLNQIQDEGSVVGTSITSLNFVGNNITATGVGAAATVTLSETPTFDSLSVTGLSTFTSAIDANGSLDVDGHTELDDVNISGVSTFASNVDINASVDISTSLTVGSATTITGSGIIAGIVTGTLDNDLTLATSGTGLSGSATYNNSGAATFTVTSDATDANTPNTIVSRDGSGNFSAGTITANLTGTASTASFATTAFTLNGTAEGNLNVGSAVTATNLAGGDAGDIPYQSSSGITTFVDASGAANNQVLLWSGSAPVWANVSDGAGAFSGISVQDESTPVGTAGSIVTLNFVGSNIQATASAGANGISTITMSDTPTFDSLNVTGLTSTQNLNVVGVSTFNNDVHVGSAITMYASTGIVSATAFYGSGGNLEDIITGKIEGIQVQEEGSDVGIGFTFSIVNFVGPGVTATAGVGSTAIITIPGDISVDTTPQLGGNLDLNNNDITGTGDVNITGIITAGEIRIASGIVSASSGIVTYYGDGQYLQNIGGGVSISTDTTNQSQYVPYVTSFGSTTGLGATNSFLFNPFIGLLEALAFSGDGSNLSNTNGFSTSLSSDPASPLYRIYKETNVLNVTAGVHTVSSDSDHDNLAFTKAGTIVISAGSTFEVSSGTTFTTNIIDLFSADEDLDVTAQNLNVLGISTFAGNVTVNAVVSAVDFNSTSDAKLKTNIRKIEDPLEKVIQIQGVSFNWIKDNRPSLGVIADEVQKVLPELVSDTDPKTVNYNGLIGLLVEVVKEQQNKIESLENRISKLE